MQAIQSNEVNSKQNPDNSPVCYSNSHRHIIDLLQPLPSKKSKPVHHALKTLFPKIPVGSYVLKPLKQGDVIYAGAFVKDNHLTLALSNDSDSQASAKVKILSKGELTITEAHAFMMLEKGDPAIEKSDKGHVISKELTVNPDNSIDVKLPADSTLTIICNFDR